MKIDKLIDEALKIATSKGGRQRKQVNRTAAKNLLACVDKVMGGTLYRLIRSI